MHQPNPNKTSPMASCTCSCSTGCPPETTDAAEPTAKPTSTQCSRPTTSNPSHRTTCPRESNWADNLTANLSTAACPREHTWAANFAADLSVALRPLERTQAADFAANVLKSTLAADFRAESNLKTTFGTEVIAGRNVIPCQDAIAIPPLPNSSICPTPLRWTMPQMQALGQRVQTQTMTPNHSSPPTMVHHSTITMGLLPAERINQSMMTMWLMPPASETI
jgi:hypothetical protein